MTDLRTMGSETLPSVAEETTSVNIDCDSQLSMKRPAMCSGCLQEITDRYILRVHPNLEFHATCLKCTDCERYMDESCTAFVRNGKTYCKDDYVRLFATKCSRCDGTFGRTDLVMRARHLVYHVNCFTCLSCEKRLVPGEEFIIKDDELYCRADCEPTNIEQPSSIKTDIFGRDEDDCWDSSTLTSLDMHMAATPPLSLHSPKSDEVITTTFHNSSSSSSGSTKKHKKDKQTTRVRTVLNEKQLMTLKTCYAANARPDALMKEQLVEMTGLSARVIRVWFQNKRCKDKKRQIAMKHMQQKAETERAITGVRVSGVGPLIAASPTTHHDPNLAGIQPVDIHQYAQNPALWASVDPMDPRRAIPPHAPIPPPAMQPSPYAQMVSNRTIGRACEAKLKGVELLYQRLKIAAPYTDLSNEVGGYGIPTSHYTVNMDSEIDFSPQINASDLSSPSCSE
uniref:Insulin gene enhancer protein isl-2b n=1 Tax=Ascaris suum TaxID=6253 RepID=F1L0E8_ASCSU